MKKAQGRNWLLIVSVGVLVLVTIAGGFLLWKRHVLQAQERRALQAVTDFLEKGRGADALQVIQQRNRTTTRQTEQQKTLWLSLEIQAVSEMGNLPRLFALYDRSPELFDKNEAASQQVGRAALHAANFEAFDKLRERWQGRETKSAGWFELDVDALLMRGKRDEAIALLNSKSFEGADDAGRLARLALINTPDNIKAAWDYLNRAAKADPRNSEVRVFRGQFLEAGGKRGAAQMEFQAALAANTNSAYYRDKLAEFFQRNGSYDLAILTWANGLTNAQSTDLIWLRTVFWSKMTRTVKFDFKAERPPFGPLQPFVEFLIALPQGSFWNEEEFQKIAEARRFDQQLQETFWLRLLNLLQSGKEEEAAKLLEFNRFRSKSWGTDLESVLMRIISYRNGNGLKLPVGVNIALSSAAPNTHHKFLEQLDALTKDPKQSVPADLDKLLRSKNVFAATFLASGWAEAALNLPHDEVIPDGYPEWLPFGFAQALRFNRGNTEALEFLSKQTPAPTLEFLAGEILLAQGKYEEGIRRLSALTSNDSDVAFRAAARVSETQLRLKKYDEARVAVESVPRLRESVEGKQLLAHVALAQGKNDEALKIYSAIESESDEAKSFLARQAFFDKNLPRARRLTEELIEKYPENLQFHRNLEDIAKAEAAK